MAHTSRIICFGMLDGPGKSLAAKMALRAITGNNSMSVKARKARARGTLPAAPGGIVVFIRFERC